MTSYLVSLKRVLIHSTFILGGKALPIYVTTIIFSIMFSLAVIYRAYAMVLGISVFSVIVIEILIASIAASMIEEISGGTAQLYLSGGLSRTEYVISWLISAVVYPAIALTLSIVIPAFIISPMTIFKELYMGYGTVYPALGVYGVALGLQLFLHILLSMIIGVWTRKKSYSILTVVLLSMIYPFIVLFLTILLTAGYYMSDLWRIPASLLLPVAPLYTLIMIPGDAIDRATWITYLLLIPLIISVLTTLIFVLKVRENLEV